MVSPGWATATASLIWRKGLAWVPGFESDPLGEQYQSVAVRRPLEQVMSKKANRVIRRMADLRAFTRNRCGISTRLLTDWQPRAYRIPAGTAGAEMPVLPRARDSICRVIGRRLTVQSAKAAAVPGEPPSGLMLEPGFAAAGEEEQSQAEAAAESAFPASAA